MSVKLIAFVIILIAAFGSAVWNVHVKKSDNSLVFVTLMVIPQCILSIPLLLMVPAPSAYSLYFILTSALIQTIYIVFLSSAYKHGMASRVYPLAVGTAPILSLVFWHHILHVHLAPLEYVGVLLLSFGIMSFIFLEKRKNQHITLKGICYALIASFFIFLYSITDTYGIRTVNNPLTYISWLFSLKGLMILLPMMYLHKIHIRTMIKKSNTYIIAGLLAGFAYAVAVWSFLHVATPVVLALRSTSIWFVFLLSIFFLNEKYTFKLLMLTISISLGVFFILIG